MLYYKYRSICERTLQILSSHQLYAPSPQQLNDPLDSQIDIELEYESAKRDLQRLPLKGEEKSQKAFLLFLLNSHRFTAKDSGERISLNQALQLWIRNLGVLSFSKNPCDPLLWSHYAQGHTGISLGFDVSRMGFSKARVLEGEVEYVSSPRYRALFLSLMEKLGEFVKPWEKGSPYPNELGDKFYTHQISVVTRENLLVKSEKWKYEEEYRVVLNKCGSFVFDPNSLREIIFGTKTAKADIEKVENILRSPQWQHVVLKRVKHVPGSFDFEVTEHRSVLPHNGADSPGQPPMS